jgi:hypothetical protein
MLEELYNPTVPKVYWWRSRAFRVSLAIFVGLAVIAVVLFNQQIGNLLRSFGSKASEAHHIILTGGTPASADERNFLDTGFYTTPFTDSFKVENGKLMLDPLANHIE